jgi:copper oxidase (laccase) domain-containing protein
MGCAPTQIRAWLGPAIGPDVFEVGEEVRSAFVQQDARAAAAFRTGSINGKFIGDLYALARLRLSCVGVHRVDGGGGCTYTDTARYYSYRRESRCGRMASLIWLQE